MKKDTATKAQDPNAAANAAVIAQNTAAAESTPAGAAPADLTPEQHEAKAAEAAVKGSGLYHLNVYYNTKVKGLEFLDQVANGVATIISKAERGTNWTAKEIETLWKKTVTDIELAIGMPTEKTDAAGTAGAPGAVAAAPAKGAQDNAPKEAA